MDDNISLEPVDNEPGLTDAIDAIPELMDNGPEPTAVPGEQTYSLAVSDYATLTVSSIPLGALCGAMFMIVGLAVLGLVKIFKKA